MNGEGSPKGALYHAQTSVSDGLDDVLRAHAVAAKTAHTIGTALISARNELPQRQYEQLLSHTCGLVSELCAERIEATL